MISAVLGVVLGILVLASPRMPGASVLLLGGAWVGLMLALTLPSRAQRAGDELASRLARFRHAVNAVGDMPTRGQLDEVLQLARDLDLRNDEIAEDLARIRASMAALSLLDEIAGGHLPVVSSPLASGDACHFVEPARMGRRRSDQYGQMLLTTGWLKFSGTADLSVAWTQIHGVQRAGEDLLVTTNDRHAVRFAFNTVEDAARAGVIAAHLRDLAQADASVNDRVAFPALV